MCYSSVCSDIQDDELNFEKLIAQAARAFSITLEYKPQLLLKYVINTPAPMTAAKTTPSLLSGRKPIATTTQADSEKSENLL
jgi:hypothetical protein